MSSGWQPNGTVVRSTDGGVSGSNVWQQDRNSGTKIIAERHDTHDQNLAESIEDTLNLDGYNAMRADLQMANFKVSNLGSPSSNSDAATFGSTLGSASFDNVTRELTLTDRSGQLIADVNIPAGAAGGDGTVTLVQGGDGITSSPPGGISSSGTLSLEDLGNGQTFDGLISQLIVDNYGRVTSATVSSGGIGETNLSSEAFTNSVRINSSTGTNALIGLADTSSDLAGLVNGSERLKLQGLQTPNLSQSRTSTTVTVSNTAGSNAVLNSATSSLAGVMSASDKSKLDGLSTGLTFVNLNESYTETTATVTNTAGTNAVLTAASSNAAGPGKAGVMTASDKAIVDAALTGEITNVTPSPGDTAGKPNGYLWGVY